MSESPMQYTALSIAGFDGSGGAGIQADLKTFSALGCYGMTVLTALPVQNTCGVRSCYEIPLNCITEQLDAVFSDIPPRAIKIGMLFNAEIVHLVSNFLQERAKDIPIVLDPVMVAKSGDILLEPSAINALKNQLIPLVDIITPNLPEASTLLGMELSTSGQMKAGAEALIQAGARSVLLKGGHSDGENSADLFMTDNGYARWFNSPRICSKNTHGTGCTLSAAIAAGLAKDLELEKACERAKEYVRGAIFAASKHSLGQGNGPVHHFYELW